MAGLIRRTGRWHYRVPQKVVTYYQNRLGLLSGQARVVPYARDGQILGFRFAYLSRGSVIHRLGFRNGDVITEVNRYQLSSMAQVMLAYFALRQHKTFLVTILRRGKQHKLLVEID